MSQLSETKVHYERHAEALRALPPEALVQLRRSGLSFGTDVCTLATSFGEDHADFVKTFSAEGMPQVEPETLQSLGFVVLHVAAHASRSEADADEVAEAVETHQALLSAGRVVYRNVRPVKARLSAEFPPPKTRQALGAQLLTLDAIFRDHPAPGLKLDDSTLARAAELGVLFSGDARPLGLAGANDLLNRAATLARKPALWVYEAAQYVYREDEAKRSRYPIPALTVGRVARPPRRAKPAAESESTPANPPASDSAETDG